jgi:probable HAF family extracellular repeat protein
VSNALEASHINASGEIVGTAMSSSPNAGNGASTELNGVVTTPFGNFPGSQGTGINDQGQIVGSMQVTQNDGSIQTHPFLYSGGKLTDLGVLPGGSGGTAYSINNSGQIVGESRVGSDTHAFLYDGGRMRDLGTLGGTSSTSVAINNLGDIIGYSLTRSGEQHAFIDHAGTMLDLTALIQSTGGITVKDVMDINDSGQISADAVVDGRVQAYLLTPDIKAVPEPGSLMIFGVLGAGFLFRSRLSRESTSGGL